MFRFLISLFVVLHGLVHLWYVALSRQWVPFKPEMGWTSHSWLLSTLLNQPATQWAATAGYGLMALLFTVAGVGFFVNAGWARPLLIGVSALSTLLILLFWNGGPELWMEKGLLGVVVNVGLVVALLVAK
jgi:hypothetical protein